MNYQPFLIGTRFRIAPPDSPAAADGRIDLLMERGAFGSGEHETTRSCLELIERNPRVTDSRLLDFGSGTGILAIGALKLGAAQAICLDIDSKAVETARHNCQLNAVDDRVTHITGTLDMVIDSVFDLILANIYGDILLDLAKPLAAKLKPGGQLLLSGILWEGNYDVRQAYEKQGCQVIKNTFLDEFSTVLMEKV